MPIISKIGSRSWSVRLVYGAIFAVLIFGALSMLYPVMLMLSGSLKSETDIMRITPWPDYLFNDETLVAKYVESKYNVIIQNAQVAWRQSVRRWEDFKPPEALEDPELLDLFLQWRETYPHWQLGHVSGGRLLPENAREFRVLMRTKYGGNLEAFNRAAGMPLKSWSDVMPPVEDVSRFPMRDGGLWTLFKPYRAERPYRDRIILNVDGHFWQRQLVPKYTHNIEEYNTAHGTDYKSYSEVWLSERVPDESQPITRKDWETYVRNVLPFAYIRLDESQARSYRQFLSERYENNIEKYAEYRPHLNGVTSFDDVEFYASLPENVMDQVDWSAYIASEECPLEALSVYGPRQSFQEFVAAARGVAVEDIAPLDLPLAHAETLDCLENKSFYRKEFATRNYKQVLEYLGLHGRGMFNTVLYCALAITVALIVNPVAAYALSRYKPPSQYKILLICMATMAFPTAVTMIPSFLLLKRFPLWPILGGAAVFAMSLWLLSIFAKRINENARMILAILAGSITGTLLVPMFIPEFNVSLLNTFAALVLPHAANGYSIFLLKGFFDSLPREIYEASDLDGASEWTKFWSFTMALSKPILAVIALQAFQHAYSQFMMALIIIPDQQMWTIMVWIYQLQSQVHQAVVYASLAVAAIPTFMIFVFCQGIIMRGIVVPTEK